jgi:hypothetical protein
MLKRISLNSSWSIEAQFFLGKCANRSIETTDDVLTFFSNLYVPRGGVGLKSLRDNSFYKNHRDIQLKMYFKSLAIIEKASISLKKSSKIIERFIKAPHF